MSGVGNVQSGICPVRESMGQSMFFQCGVCTANGISTSRSRYHGLTATGKKDTPTTT